MRAPFLVLIVTVVAALSGVAGYTLATTTKNQEIAALRQAQEKGLIRERELRAQLQEALAAHAALTQQTQRLQEDLQERLRRLEEATAQLVPSEPPPEESPQP